MPLSSIDIVKISVIKAEIDLLRSRILPHDTGHLHTTIHVLEHRLQELENAED